jgi:hypothetical protein
MFYNAPSSNVPPIVPFSVPNAPVSPANPSPMNYLIVVLFCRGRCHRHPSCSRLLSIVMHSSSLIPQALILRNSRHFCRCPSSIAATVFLLFLTPVHCLIVELLLSPSPLPSSSLSSSSSSSSSLSSSSSSSSSSLSSLSSSSSSLLSVGLSSPPHLPLPSFLLVIVAVLSRLSLCHPPFHFQPHPPESPSSVIPPSPSME